MKDLTKKFKDSPYDASGMPLAVETVDYDKKDDVAAKTVKDKFVEPEHIHDVEFDSDVTVQDWQKRTKFNPALNNTAIQFPGHRIHKAHEGDIGTGITELTDMPNQIDLEDPAAARKEIVEDSLEKGKEVPKLPEAAKKEDVEAVVKGETNTSGVEEKDNEPDNGGDNPDDIMKLLEATDNDGK